MHYLINGYKNYGSSIYTHYLLHYNYSLTPKPNVNFYIEYE